MSNAIPLPRPGSLGLIQYAGVDMLQYAAAVSAAKDAEIAKLKTVMIAAAEEIQAHWDAHCDAEGYGPANLMRRLEEGIPSQYGYTAGAFGQLRADNEQYVKIASEFGERVRVLEDALRPFAFTDLCLDGTPKDFAMHVLAARAALEKAP